ncbi:NADP-dependent oxidoreductase domain-containing protein [Stachybotrys elegans]|uniref:NADP-dependent oxidoreductase domain-containing protein n=1 Tax=Stachybotrys elegans TaxID=80388 RepID=A0A8K0SU55_9HYPO|nr:NADP-dependent oxidoreductase domain-containing protein [Stachybotrys elegans]
MGQRTIADTVTLPNETKIPQLGFGVWASPPQLCTNSCLNALECGYRHIDTGQCYGNEAEVGKAVQQSLLDRGDLFITTKILTAGGSVDKSYEKCIESARKLDPKSGYVDLFLIHSPDCSKKERLEMWQALERMYEEGKAKSIGVSNFGISNIQELKEVAKMWPPHVNQIELHPWCQQREIVEYCEKNGIVVEAYCPIVRNQKADDEHLVAIAGKHGVTANQVLLRWSLQKGWIPLPKSDNKDRIKTNANLYSFELDEQDMATLDGLDQGAAGAIVEAVQN